MLACDEGGRMETHNEQLKNKKVYIINKYVTAASSCQYSGKGELIHYVTCNVHFQIGIHGFPR